MAPKKLSTAKQKIKEQKEVATKLRNMKPTEQAQIVNSVVTRQVGKHLVGFEDFLRDQSVIGIGIGLVLGTQLKTVVDSITSGLVLPLTQLVLPNQKSLINQVWVVHLGHKASASIAWGSMAYSLFEFIVVAFIVYAIFKLFKLDKLSKKKS